MTGRERLLTALSNGKPDRLPCQVHSWMKYYLNTYLGGVDQFAAYERFKMDPVIYDFPVLKYGENDLKNCTHERNNTGVSDDGVTSFDEKWVTPKGTLYSKGSFNKYTSWETEHMVKNEEDFELYKKYYPVAIGADWSTIKEAKKRIGDSGIVRTWNGSYGQPGSWQSLCYLMGTENAILKSFDDPDWVHYALQTITDKALKQIEACGKIAADLVENGGGSASSTVISPTMHKEFCLPYDIMINEAIKSQGAYVVYHLCGGLMPLLDIVAGNGAHTLETMTPAAMGGDCDLKLAAKKVGNKLSFVGGFDQNAGFERGNKHYIENSVQSLFESKPNGGLILSPSDHFFFGDPQNIQYFVDACKSCKY